jgi:hypothetical protein
MLAHGSEQRQVIRLGPAAHKHDLARLAADQGRDLPPRIFQPLLGGLSEMMDAGSVTIHLTETRHRGLQHFRRHRGCRIVIEVKTLHFFLF